MSPEARHSLRLRRRALLLLGFVLLFAAGVSAMMFGIRPLPHPHFVPLWVTEYESPGLPPRPSAGHDEDAFRDGRYFEQAVPDANTALDAKSLVQQIAGLKSLPSYIPVVLYLSAHAHASGSGEVLVMPANADPVTGRNAVPLRELLTALAACPSGHKLLLLDLMDPLTDARLGQLAQDVPTAVQLDLAAVPDPARLVLCSCSPGQRSLASDDQQRTIFGYYVEAGLRGAANGFNQRGDRNGQVSARELAEFVRARVERWSWQNRRVHQTPLLFGEGGDFPLVTLDHRQAKPPLPVPAAEKYPDFLREGWKVRQRWWTDESYRAAPQLFRALETALLEAERDWQAGTDAARVQETLKTRLIRLEQKLKSAAIPKLAKPPSLALEAAGRPPNEVALAAIERELGAARVKPRLPGDKAPTLSPELVTALEKIPTFEVLYAAFEVAANDPQPRPDGIRLLNLLIQTRQPEHQYAETLFLERLAELPDANWPTESVRQALEVVRLGERTASDSSVYPWIQDPLEEAAQARFEAELVLLGGAGYVPPGETGRRLQLAAERTEAVRSRADSVRALQRQLDAAFALLPAITPFVERTPTADSAWFEAIETCVKLEQLLAAAPDDFSAAALPMAQLEDALRRLQRPFAADNLAALQVRLRRKGDVVPALNEAEAILATPLLAPEQREALWTATRACSRRLHEETLRQDEADANLSPVLLEAAHEPAPAERLDATDAKLALRRAHISLALLQLGGLPADVQATLTEQWQQTSAAFGGDTGRAALATLGDALRQTWTQRVPELLASDASPLQRDRLGQVYLPFDLAVVYDDAAPLPRTDLRTQQERSLLTWRADRIRYESRELTALDLLSDKGTRYYSRAAAAYQTQAAPLPREASCQIISDPPLLRLTPQTTQALPTLTFRGVAPPTEAIPLPVRVLTPDTTWLQITPGLPNAVALGADTLLRLPAPVLPLTVRLNPGAEGKPPQGVWLEAACGRRTVHYRLPVSLDAVSDRIEVLLSRNPQTAAEPLDELRLRPLKTRQSYYLYLHNPSAKPRKLVVQLVGSQGLLPGGEAKVELGPKDTKPIHFGPAPTGAPPDGVFTDLAGDLQVKLLDPEDGNKVVDTRTIRVRVAAAADYTKVTDIRFTPPAQRDRGLGSGQNKLTVTVQATADLTGPPCPVELILPAARIPGFLGVRAGTQRGELAPRGRLTLDAENLQLADGAAEDGVAYLAVDGDERAYVFRTTFARLGDPTTPREDIAPALRLVTGRFGASGAASAVTLEVDRPPEGASLELSLGRYRNGTFEGDASYTRPTAKRQRIACSPTGPGGALLFEASTGDWQIQPETSKVVGPRVLRGRLLDKDGQAIRTEFATLTLDDKAPQAIHFVEVPRLAKKDAPLVLKAMADASLSGISEVFFFPGRDVQNKPPQGVTPIAGKPVDEAKTTWTATLPLHVEKAGPAEFTAQFVNRAGLSTFATVTIELIDGDPSAVLPGRVEGVVQEGAIPQPGLTVSLRDEKGVEKQTAKTDENGAFVFEKVTPGKYQLVTMKSATRRQGSAAIAVVADQTTVAAIKLLKP